MYCKYFQYFIFATLLGEGHILSATIIQHIKPLKRQMNHTFHSYTTMHLLLELPLSVVQGTHLSCLQPAGDTVEMERMLLQRTEEIFSTHQVSKHFKSVHHLLRSRGRCVVTYIADAPGHSALLRRCRGLVGLALYA